jgi:hypothetical protein
MTNEVAQGLKPDVRVAYVDLDPVVLTHARLLEDGRTRVIEADIFDPMSLLARHDIEDFFDWTRAVAVVNTMTLGHCHDDLDPAEVMNTYMESLPAGSYSVISHCAAPDGREGQVALLQPPPFVEAFGERWFRPIADIERFFTGQYLVHSGLTPDTERLEDTAPHTDYWREFIVAGIGCTDVDAAERLEAQLASEPECPLPRRLRRA